MRLGIPVGAISSRRLIYSAQMDDEARKLASERLRMGIHLSDAVLTMRRQRIKRDNPGRSARDVDALLNAELWDRPMDGDGVVRRSK